MSNGFLISMLKNKSALKYKEDIYCAIIAHNKIYILIYHILDNCSTLDERIRLSELRLKV